MWAAGAVVTFLLARSIGSTVVYETNSNPVVSAGERTAMTWIARHVSPSNQFLAIGTNTGSSEEDVEWFPALTGRSSVLTLQGTEWIPGLYARRSTEIQAVQACMPRLSCIERDLSRHHIPFSYVYLARASSQEPCESLCAALSHGSRYIRVYSGPGAWVFRRAGST
jgi:hypothetical protein